MEQTIMQDMRMARMMRSLEGLSVGDAFGQQFFYKRDLIGQRFAERTIPSPPWPYTDDTQMALSIVSVLQQYETIEQDRLARSFADHYEPGRAYGPSMHGQLRSYRAGSPWKETAHNQFEGQGSFGNGAAMRVAPLGAYFSDSIDAVIEQATLSSEVTHTHPEAIAGSIAIAVAAAWSWRLGEANTLPERAEFFDLILASVPTSEVRRKMRWARDMSTTTSVESAVAVLGNGIGISAQDTVPFALWCAGTYLADYEEALWLTASGLGDVDTTCAMVGGIVALYTGIESIPIAWRQARETLPNWPFTGKYHLTEETYE